MKVPHGWKSFTAGWKLDCSSRVHQVLPFAFSITNYPRRSMAHVCMKLGGAKCPVVKERSGATFAGSCLARERSSTRSSATHVPCAMFSGRTYATRQGSFLCRKSCSKDFAYVKKQHPSRSKMEVPLGPPIPLQFDLLLLSLCVRYEANSLVVARFHH